MYIQEHCDIIMYYVSIDIENLLIIILIHKWSMCFIFAIDFKDREMIKSFLKIALWPWPSPWWEKDVSKIKKTNLFWHVKKWHVFYRQVFLDLSKINMSFLDMSFLTYLFWHVLKRHVYIFRQILFRHI